MKYRRFAMFTNAAIQQVNRRQSIKNIGRDYHRKVSRYTTTRRSFPSTADGQDQAVMDRASLANRPASVRQVVG